MTSEFSDTVRATFEGELPSIVEEERPNNEAILNSNHGMPLSERQIRVEVINPEL